MLGFVQLMLGLVTDAWTYTGLYFINALLVGALPYQLMLGYVELMMGLVTDAWTCIGLSFLNTLLVGA